MKAVWSWLQELCDFSADVSPEQAAAALTAGGLEVEAIESVGQDFTGVVVAEVVAKRKHPDADKLTLVDVIDSNGGTATEVVCGAPNVPDAGGRVLWAKPGAVLPGSFEISPRKIKGVVSSGMLCSEDELGLGDDHDGIMVLEDGERSAALGSDPRSSLTLSDYVFDISAPANRPDSLGHLGLARELCAHLGGTVVAPDVDLTAVTGDDAAADRIAVEIADAVGCPRYTARLVSGLTVGQAPRWMRLRLLHVGVRPLSNLVDVTNYVMFELGQPLHGFDYDRVRGQKIVVRRARAGEQMKTLDDVLRTLEPDDLLICDGEGPVALAGVMGGLESEVENHTTSVLIESAAFEPKSIRRTARRLGLHSEASHRFERHVDRTTADIASARASLLMARCGGGTVSRGMVDAYPTVAEPAVVAFRASRATALTGVEFSRDRASELFTRLGLSPEPGESDDELRVTCPPSRPDLTREVDLVEEALRLYGFDKVPATLPRGGAAPSRRSDRVADLCREALTAAGLCEAITFGFTSPDKIAALGLGDADPRSIPVALINPMTVEQSVMRTSLLPNLLAAVAHNLKFEQDRVALFEIGSVFFKSEAELPDERSFVAGVLAGKRPRWLDGDHDVDVFDLKGAVDELFAALLGSDPDDATGSARSAGEPLSPTFHPGVQQRLYAGKGGSWVGTLGEVHPTVRAAFDIDVPVFAFEIELDKMPAPAHRSMTPVPRYPAIVRDLSFFVDEHTAAATVRDHIDGADVDLIERVQLLEDYRDPAHVPAGKKGMLWSITYRSPEKTLTDAEIEKTHEALITGLLGALSADRR